MTRGQRIQKRREELGLTQEGLAHRIGYKSKSSINKIELDIQQLRASKIKAIAEALSTTTEYIMGWDEEEKETRVVIERKVLDLEGFTEEQIKRIKAYAEFIRSHKDEEV